MLAFQVIFEQSTHTARAPEVVFQHTRATLRFGALCAHSRVSFWNCWALPELLGLCFSVSALCVHFHKCCQSFQGCVSAFQGCTSTSIAGASEAAFAYSRGCAAICCAALVLRSFGAWRATRGTSCNGVACEALRGKRCNCACFVPARPSGTRDFRKAVDNAQLSCDARKYTSFV